MTVLSAMQSAAIKLIGRKPSVFFSSQNQFEMEIVDLVNEAATDIMRYTDWQSLIQVANFTGDGLIDAFDMPSGYDRMVLTADIQDANNYVWGFQHVPSVSDFMMVKIRALAPWPGVWSIYDDKFNFYPAPPAGQLATFPYISKNYALAADGTTTKPAFTADDDTFRVKNGERLIALWLVWRWRENKKLDFTGDQENFVKALDEVAAKDRGSRVYRSYTSRLRGNFGWAYPYQLG